MAEKDLPSCSDESDEDYIPDAEECANLSEEADSDVENISCDNDSDSESKPKKKGKRKKIKSKEKGDEEKKNEADEECEETVKKKPKVDVDSLWADFKKDVEDTIVRKTDNVSQSKVEESTNEKKIHSNDQNKVLPTSTTTRKPSVLPLNRPVGGASKGGLSSILGQLGKKDKISTLEKSKLDWEKFKNAEGISEELQTFNRGKDGYLEKQDFLQRADLRQYEIEKQLRQSQRRFY